MFKCMQTLLENHEFLIILSVILFFVAVGGMIVWVSLSSFCKNVVLNLEGIVPPFVTFPAILFSLSATLTATTLWENYAAAIRSVQTESQGIATILDISAAVPILKGSDVPALAKQYAQSVVRDEWATLTSDHNTSPITRKHYEEFLHVAYKAVDSLGNNAESKALMSAIESVTSGREARLGCVAFDVNQVRLCGIILLGILVQLAVAIVHLNKPKALITAVTMATFAVLTPISTITFTASGPFVGFIAISPKPFLQFMK